MSGSARRRLDDRRTAHYENSIGAANGITRLAAVLAAHVDNDPALLELVADIAERADSLRRLYIREMHRQQRLAKATGVADAVDLATREVRAVRQLAEDAAAHSTDDRTLAALANVEAALAYMEAALEIVEDESE